MLRNARIYTVNPQQPWAQALAVRGKDIVYVGQDDDAALKAHIGAGTRVVDLQGKMVVPGFIDSHIHPLLSSFMTAGADLQHETREQMLRALEDYARAHPAGLVSGFGWRTDMFGPEGPDRRELDRIFPDRPAYMLNIDYHSMWFNSRALEMVGVDRNTRDPAPGFAFWQRDKDGEPTGYAVEPATYMEALNKLVPLTPETFGAYVGKWMPRAAAAGLTGGFDAGVPPVADQGDLLSAYLKLERRGELLMRLGVSYATRGPDDPPPLPGLQAVRARIHSELVHVAALKIMGDGTEGGWTAALLEPYADKPETRGATTFPTAQFHALIAEADKAGVNVHVHCDGDACTRTVLDAVEAAMAANPPRDRRHTICHLVSIDPADVPRFGKLGVLAQVGVNWATADPDSLGVLRLRLGSQRFENNVYPARALVESGARVTLGTDWAAAGYFSTYKPLDVIQIGMTRQLIGKPDAPILPPEDQRMTLAQMLKGYTLDPAYQIGLDKQVGSLEVGKRADLVVLGRNLFEVAPHDIHKVAVVATMMNGRLTHGSLPAARR
ncbi:amidohydrolase family protein [Comamonas flocculans]|uniref:Amidohydrolase family protein n=1 Tax=Comamonas flocculans TaxID=2597701 RepID=A0A5B8S137_9BURK|nr:amidohydrolase family protein [Comamonas flocculans]